MATCPLRPYSGAGMFGFVTWPSRTSATTEYVSGSSRRFRFALNSTLMSAWTPRSSRALPVGGLWLQHGSRSPALASRIARLRRARSLSAESVAT